MYYLTAYILFLLLELYTPHVSNIYTLCTYVGKTINTTCARFRRFHDIKLPTCRYLMLCRYTCIQ